MAPGAAAPAEVLHARVCAGADTESLRRAVLRPDWPASRSLTDTEGPGAVHLGVFDADEVVGACLLYPEPCPFRQEDPAWRLRGMAVQPNRRGSGVGRVLLASACQVSSDQGAKILWCQARETAVGFYEKEGWIGVDELFEAVGLPHRSMWRLLP